MVTRLVKRRIEIAAKERFAEVNSEITNTMHSTKTKEKTTTGSGIYFLRFFMKMKK